MDSPRRTRAVVQFDHTAVRATSLLDSEVVTTLDGGCEVWVVETKTLASGRERARLDAPVEGWVSAMFIEERDASDDSDGEDDGATAPPPAPPSTVASPAPPRPAPDAWAAPLAPKVRARLAAVAGNDRCFYCNAQLDALAAADGEGAWGDASLGAVCCEPCGARRRACRSLDWDAWGPAAVAAFLLGGNGRLRAYLEERGALAEDVREPCFCRADMSPMHRGGAAAGTWIFGREGSWPGRGSPVSTNRGGGYSAKTNRGDAAATT